MNDYGDASTIGLVFHAINERLERIEEHLGITELVPAAAALEVLLAAEDAADGGVE